MDSYARQKFQHLAGLLIDVEILAGSPPPDHVEGQPIPAADRGEIHRARIALRLNGLKNQVTRLMLYYSDGLTDEQIDALNSQKKGGE
jgi:hypothetical protein